MEYNKCGRDSITGESPCDFNANKTREYESETCHPVHDEFGRRIGSVCSIPEKDLSRNNVFFMPDKGETKPVRTIVELTNKLRSAGVPPSECEKTLDFLNSRLRVLKESFKSFAVETPFDGVEVKDQRLAEEGDKSNGL